VILLALGAALLISRGYDGSHLDFRRFWGNIVGKASTGSVERLFAGQRSNVFVELEGSVTRVLADDLQGARHQRFIVELPSGHTVLVVHNIDLAPRVPVNHGDAVEVRGEYEWNDRGGVVHWTHRDPQGRKVGGWIRHSGREYR
jgi:hypothetical protein